MTTEPVPERQTNPGVLISIALLAATLAVYGQTATSDFDFIHADDPDYVLNNPHVNSGLSFDNVRWAIGALEANNWHPLTWISLQIDCELFGVSSQASHLINALIHAANAILLFWLLRRMTGAVWPSAAVAAFFALHPTHVESVAWITERKDVLSALFWLLTTLAYVRYTERPSVVRYAVMLITFALGLTAKPMLVTLPATLLLLDYWPLRRWPGRVSIGRLILEKLPLFVLVAATIPLTIAAQAKVAKSLEQFTPLVRVENALVAYMQYIGMLFWPMDLAIFYPHPRDTIAMWKAIAAGVVLLILTIGSLLVARRRPYVVVGWLWFLGTLVPVIGLMQVGMQGLADRYTYIPYIGLFIILVWGVADATNDWVGRARPLGAVAAALLIACAALSLLQVRYWRNSETLWRHNLAVTRDDGTANEALARELVEQGRYEEAVPNLREAIRLGRHMAGTHGNLAVALENLGDLEGAAEQYRITLYIEPDLIPIRVGLARVRESQGRNAEARKIFEDVVRREPESTAAHVDLGRVLNRLGQHDEALAELDTALRLQPDFAEAHNTKGLVLEGRGRLKDAVASYRRAVQSDPGNFVYRCNLGYALYDNGETAAAAKEYAAATRLRSDWPELAFAEAWQKATSADPAHRNGAQALRAAQQLIRGTGSRYPQALDALAAAYAERDQFDDAVATQRKLLATANIPPESRNEFAARLALYEKKEKYRQR